jgi:hypothetical protein
MGSGAVASPGLSNFSAAWLALREPADKEARSLHLAGRFAEILPRPCAILDLGAGTGANARALAPLIGGDQRWTLVERDPRLLAAQARAFQDWARRNHYDSRIIARGIVVASAHGTWRFERDARDLAGDWRANQWPDIDGVTAAALFDLVSAAWLARFIDLLAARALPLLAVLTVDGRRDWMPALAADTSVAAAFRRDQVRDKGFGPALGAEAARALARQLAAAGFEVATAASTWRLDHRHRRLLRALVAAEARAAQHWTEQRLAQAAAGRLSVTIGHRDVLALPRGI